VPFELIKPNTRIDFVGQTKYAIALSLLIVAAAVAAMFVREPPVRLGIDFTGGLEMQVSFTQGAAVDEARIRDVLADFDLADAEVIRVGESSGGEYLLRMHQRSLGDQNEVVDRLREAFVQQLGGVDLKKEKIGFVGPKVGEDLRRDGLVSLTVASVLLLIYIGFRFTPIFAPGAIVAQVHDIVVTAALLVILGREFDLTVLGALLAILGYSINDKIVVYDRIRENLALHTAYDFPHMVNDSLNQTLSRTILTGGTAIFASFALYFWGGPVIATFGLAMGLGIIVGTYSSLYITTPILLWLHKRYGKQIAGAGAAAGKKGGKRGPDGNRRAGRVA
jgi:preprotein translocase subunit SecF